MVDINDEITVDELIELLYEMDIEGLDHVAVLQE